MGSGSKWLGSPLPLTAWPNITDPAALALPNNYDLCFKRHISFRKSFDKLSPDVQAEFDNRLSSGLDKDYWEIVPPEDVDQLRQPEEGGYWLPANFVLNEPDSGTTTKCRLV